MSPGDAGITTGTSTITDVAAIGVFVSGCGGEEPANRRSPGNLLRRGGNAVAWRSVQPHTARDASTRFPAHWGRLRGFNPHHLSITIVVGGGPRDYVSG